MVYRPLEIAATYGKAKSLDQMLQLLDRQRVLKENIDMPDEEGRTPLMVRLRVPPSPAI